MDNGLAELRPQPKAEAPLRMRDLCSATGLPRQAIHFYIQQGLLPPGKKTGRNTAIYDHTHVERLQLILRLKNERFLPLKAIKAVIDGQDQGFTPAQQNFLADVKRELRERENNAPASLTTIRDTEVLARTGLQMEDLVQALELELLAGRREEDGTLWLAERDLWILEAFSEMRSNGFTRDLGFDLSDLTFYGEILDELFQRELLLVSSKLAHLPPNQVAQMIQSTLPVIHKFLALYHGKRVKEFFETTN